MRIKKLFSIPLTISLVASLQLSLTFSKTAIPIHSEEASEESMPQINSKEPWEANTIEPISYKLNLFDYSNKDERSGNGITVPEKNPNNDPTVEGSGINSNHNLKFGNRLSTLWSGAVAASEGYSSLATDGKRITPGLVQNTLVNGYPALNLDEVIYRESSLGGKTKEERIEAYFGKLKKSNGKDQNGQDNPFYYYDDSDKLRESLDYLFDPNYSGENSFRNVYEDLKGFFRLDNDGYYYYSSLENYIYLDLEQYDQIGKKDFKVCNIPALPNKLLFDEKYKAGNQKVAGQFFPFNDPFATVSIQKSNEETHDFGPFIENNNNVLTAIEQAESEYKTFETGINHYFGMTLAIDFQQPVGGTISTADDTSMVFEFTGDDDVWVFIDDVLVLDIGGAHTAQYGRIDFKTGDIAVGVAGLANNKDLSKPGEVQKWTLLENARNAVVEENLKSWYSQNLYECFDKAGRSQGVAWKDLGNGQKTFADNSIHTLKLFYLEKGAASNLSMRMNLQPVNIEQIKKIDETGDPLGDVEFSLHKAYKKDLGLKGLNEDSNLLADDFEVEKTPLTTVRTKPDEIHKGIADLVDLSGNPLVFTGHEYYALREKTPLGFRVNPDVILKYDNVNGTGTFEVVNQEETGAYTSFLTTWEQVSIPLSLGEYDPKYAIYDQDPNVTDIRGSIKNLNITVSQEDLANGLTMVVPVTRDPSDEKCWVPIFGSNIKGWAALNELSSTGRPQESFIESLFITALMQIADDSIEDWYLDYSQNSDRLLATLYDLPGNSSRYVENDKNGDLNLVPIFIPGNLLEKIIGEPIDSTTQRYERLKNTIQSRIGGKTDDKPALDTENEIKNYLQKESVEFDSIKILYRGSFSRNYHSIIYVPNEQRELRIYKQDPDGAAVPGAVFALFKSLDKANSFSFSKLELNEPYSGEDIAKELNNKADEYGILSAGVTANNVIVSQKSDIITGKELETTHQGVLIFSEHPYADSKKGYAKTLWPDTTTMNLYGEIEDKEQDPTFWLKEIYCPDPYELNEYLIRVEARNTAIYANATGYLARTEDNGEISLSPATEDDGITVTAALGRLTQSHVQFALDNPIETTMQDIHIEMQTNTPDSSGAPATIKPDNEESLQAKWDTTESNYNLHYGLNETLLSSQYGRHNKDSDLPTFTVDNGYVRVKPTQNLDLGQYDEKVGTIRRDLKDTNLSGLFTLINVVNIKENFKTGSLTLYKEIGEEIQINNVLDPIIPDTNLDSDFTLDPEVNNQDKADGVTSSENDVFEGTEGSPPENEMDTDVAEPEESVNNDEITSENRQGLEESDSLLGDQVLRNNKTHFEVLSSNAEDLNKKKFVFEVILYREIVSADGSTIRRPLSGTFNGYQFDLDGKSRIKVSKDESVILTGIPVGTHYIVREILEDGFLIKNEEHTERTGIIKEDDGTGYGESVTITNHPISLARLSKSVNVLFKEEDALDRTFEYTITWKNLLAHNHIMKISDPLDVGFDLVSTTYNGQTLTKEDLDNGSKSFGGEFENVSVSYKDHKITWKFNDKDQEFNPDESIEECPFIEGTITLVVQFNTEYERKWIPGIGSLDETDYDITSNSYLLLNQCYLRIKNDSDGSKYGQNSDVITVHIQKKNEPQDSEEEPATPNVPSLPTIPDQPKEPEDPKPSEPGLPETPEVLIKDHYAYIIGRNYQYAAPNESIAREEIVTIFFRLLTDEARNKYWSVNQSYPDVYKELWHNNAIATMSNMGVVQGYDDGLFRPSQAMTRAELAKVAVSFFPEGNIVSPANVIPTFSDINGHWAEEYIREAAAIGLVQGYSDGTYRPDNPITRAEAMSIINRLIGRKPHQNGLGFYDEKYQITWPDNQDKNEWYYGIVQEATNSHTHSMDLIVNGQIYENWQDPLEVRDWAAFEKMWADANASKNPGEVID